MKKNANCEKVLSALERGQDRNSGDYNSFWKARDYNTDASKVKAAVFVVHGHNDWNVKGQNYQHWWEALTKAKVTRKIWIHKGGHEEPGRNDWRRESQRWFDRYLKGQRNGIDAEAMAELETPNGTWLKADNWPDPKAKDTTLKFGAAQADSPGTLDAETLGGAVQSFTDAGRSRKAGDLIANPDKTDSGRVAFQGKALGSEARLTGAPKIKLSLSVDNRADANVTALLVDYAPGGSGTIVTRGWIDPQNHNGIDKTEKIKQGQKYDLSFEMMPKEYVFAKGHRIGLVVISTDYDYTLRPEAGTKLSVDPAGSSVTLKLVGG